MQYNLNKLKGKHVKNMMYPKEKRIQAVVQYLSLGNMKLVSETTGIDYGLLRKWKMQPWWNDYEREIRQTENLALDSKLTKLVDKSLDAVVDRLQDGDYIYDSKTGEIKRKPVNMKDAAKVSVDLLTKRELLRGNATSRTEAQAVPIQDQLKVLAQEFARMVSGKPQEIIDVEMVEVLRNDTFDTVEMALPDGYSDSVFPDDELEEDDEMGEGDESSGATGTDSGHGEEQIPSVRQP